MDSVKGSTGKLKPRVSPRIASYTQDLCCLNVHSCQIWPQNKVYVARIIQTQTSTSTTQKKVEEHYTLHLCLEFGGRWSVILWDPKLQIGSRVLKCQRETNAEGSARQSFVNPSLRCPFQNVPYGRRPKCPRWILWESQDWSRSKNSRK